jgi:nucleotide-binding universal stress UspA family protein
MFERILVPLDGSRLSAKALPYAVEMAHRFGAGVILIRVTTPMPGVFARTAAPSLMAPVDPATAEMVVDQARRAAQAEERKARRYLNRHRRGIEGQGIQASIRIDAGAAAERILAACDEEGIDLVVMATRGRGGIRRTLLGSVADRVIRESGIPVLAIRP